jgi:hypothetical protein
MSPSLEEAATGAGADTGSVVSEEVRAVANGADAGFVISVAVRVLAGGAGADSVISADVRVLLAGADTGSVVSEEVRPVAGGADAGLVIFADVRVLAAGADCGGVSVSVADVSVSVGDDVSRALVDRVCRSRLRNRRHVSELCSRLAAVVATAGFAPKASLVSTSSCPVTARPLRTW